MYKELELVRLIEEYRNKVDSYQYSPNLNKLETIDDVAYNLSGLRRLCEDLLPQLVFRANALEYPELVRLYTENQKLDIEDYNYRLEVYKLIVSPSDVLEKMFDKFRESVNIE